MDDYENEALPVGEAQVAEAMQTLQRYKAGKAALDKRIVDNELWFRMGHWKNYQNPMMPGKAQPSSGWLFNSIANKHADAMDNYPEPNVLPREADDEDTARHFPAFCRWCWNRPTTSRCTATAGGASSNRAPA